MSGLSALTPPAAPRTSPAANVMAFQMERRTQAAATVAAVRAAAGEDPRAALRLAHADKLAAAADIARLTDTLARARQHLAATAARRSAAEAHARHADSEAAAGLIAAFSAAASAAVAVDDDAAAKAAKLGREAEIAGAAADRLAAELAAAEDRERVCAWRVKALALAVVEAHGEALAEAMLAEQQEMRNRRAQLSDLQLLLTTEGRAVFGDAVSPPAAIAAAVTATDPPAAWRPSSPYVSRPADPPNPWTGCFRTLLEDAEAKVGY
jgi:hypothetical protein